MKRNILLASATVLAIAFVAWWRSRPPRHVDAPALAVDARVDAANAAENARVPMGETVERTFYDDAGVPEVWTLWKREVDREDLDDLVLPSPAPREEPPGPHTDAARALNAEALEAWKLGDIKQALQLFEAATQADPDDALPHSDYGRLLTLMTAYGEALPHLERAAELEPENPRVWLDLLSLYEKGLLLERAAYARERAERFAKGRPIVRDKTSLWRFEDESIFP
jgi:tetratricopeptide (TPR) repeat protein